MDELGGVTRALELAKQLAGLPEDPAATETLEWPPRWGNKVITKHLIAAVLLLSSQAWPK